MPIIGAPNAADHMGQTSLAYLFGNASPGHQASCGTAEIVQRPRLRQWHSLIKLPLPIAEAAKCCCTIDREYEAFSVGSHVVSPRNRQSGASRSSHRRVLADAWRARRDPADQPARQLRVRDAPRAPDQDRCACHRAHRAHPRPAADKLPGGSIVQSRRARSAAIRPMTCGATCPQMTRRHRHINSKRVAQRIIPHRSNRTDRRRATARKDKIVILVHDYGYVHEPATPPPIFSLQ
jgi:hypothetical protein